MTFHAACGRILRREADRLGYRSNFTIYDQADQVRVVQGVPRGARSRPEALPAARHPLAHLVREEPPRLRGRVPREHRQLLRPGRGRRLRALRAPAARRRTRWTSTTCWCAASTCSRASTTCASAGRARSTTCSSTSTRTPTTRSTASCACSPTRTATSSSVGDADQSIYTWRGADIRNILDFERDFPDARVVRLEQNYRSTQRILDAANAVIEHNAGRIEKRLWSELGSGEPVRVIEAEDEHDEARIVAARIGAARSRAARAPRDDRRLLPHERAVARARGPARAPRRALPGDRRRRASTSAPRSRTRWRTCSVLDNPTDEIALRRIINQPRRGIGDAERRSPGRRRRASAAARSGMRSTDPEAAGLGDGRRALGARLPRAHGRAARSAPSSSRCGELLETLLARTGVIEALEAERRRSRRRAASRTSRSSSASRASTSRAARSRRSRASCRRSR